jgi:DUF917 family protein
MRLLNKEEIYDILYGCTVLGTGGGGDLQGGFDLINRDIENGLEFKLVALDEIPDDAIVSSPYRCGCVFPSSKEEMEKYAGLKEIDDATSLVAFKALGDYLGQPLFASLPGELGGYNTAVAMSVAARMGIPIVDADPAGRSVPELQHSTLYMHNIDNVPLVVATKFGDVMILKQVGSEFRTEALVRSLAIVSQNSVGVSDPPVRGKQLKNAVIPGTISHSQKIGKALTDAWGKGEDPAAKVAEAGNGYILFRGTVNDFTWGVSEGFTIGDTYIKGVEDYSGNEYRIWFKNEHIISWKNGQVYITVPDLICIFDRNTGQPVTNPNITIGMDVTVIGLPSPKEWRTEKGLQLFGPKHFGYNVEYIPLERIMNNSSGSGVG